MKICKIAGCENQAIVKEMCQKHYKRLSRNGDPEKLSDRFHGKSGSDIYDLFQNIKKNNAVDWPDFNSFYKDVGEKPSPCHHLRRKEKNKPFGKNNFYWYITDENKKYLISRGFKLDA